MANRFLILCLLFCSFFFGCQQKKEIGKNPVVRYGSLIGLKKDYEERYIILHKHTFPGVLDRIRKCNIQNYSIFLRNGLLFSHFEYAGSDFETDMANMADETTKEWWKLTDPMQEPLENRKEGEWWASMDLYFQMDTSKIPFEHAQRFAFTGYLKDGEEQSFKEKLQTLDKSFYQIILDANIQNIVIYGKDNQVFLYYEYVGSDFQTDMERLENNEEFKTLNLILKAKMKHSTDGLTDRYWFEMEEVFHTN